MKTDNEKIYPNGEKLTYCSDCALGGCGKMTKSVLSDDKTHYYCEECEATK